MGQRKQWTKQEDQVLILLKVNRKVEKWSKISQIMLTEFGIKGRSGKQCRERFHNHLDLQICKRAWTHEEEALLFRLHDDWGNRWAPIAREIPGRTDNCVKNHFYSYLRKCMKNINCLIYSHLRKTTRQIKPTIVGKVISIIEMYHQNPHSFSEQVFDASKNIKKSILYFHKDPSQYDQSQCQILILKLCEDIFDLNKATRNKLKKKKKTEEQADPQERIKIFRNSKKNVSSEYNSISDAEQSLKSGQLSMFEQEKQFVKEAHSIENHQQIDAQEYAVVKSEPPENVQPHLHLIQQCKDEEFLLKNSYGESCSDKNYLAQQQWMSTIFFF